MSAPVALPAPKVFRLPRVRFKRPRWPRGNRLYLCGAVVDLLIGLFMPPIGPNPSTAIALAASGWLFYRWWRSRDDDDGPSAT